MVPTDDVILSVKGTRYAGWLSGRVTRGIELMPSNFMISMTERYPGQPSMLEPQPGDDCVVQIGKDSVLTGWIDRVMSSIDARGHHITILGRGRCCDLVDCSAFASNQQFLNRSILDIATAVCKPFGIKVLQRDPGTSVVKNQQLTADGQIIPQLNVNLTVTPWQIIEEMARYASLIAYEMPDGNVMLAQPGTVEAKSGFTQGANVQSASSMGSLDQRYSNVWALALAIDSTIQLHPGAPAGTSDANVIAKEQDSTVPRYRPLVIISEQGWGAWDITARRAKWEIARRYGRSQAVTITADSWRDGEGKLWEVNTLAPLDIPALHLGNKKWLISEVAFIFDPHRGKIAEVTMMPREAFLPQPPSVMLDWQVQKAIQDSTDAAPPVSVGPAHA
jgi:prophage tail gpP-like protein